MPSPSPASLSPPIKAPLPPAGGLTKALTHHGHVGAALKAGDHKKAMHHVGHMMLAIKDAAKATGISAASPLADGDVDDSTQPLPSPSAPAKPFNRAAFGAMKGAMKKSLPNQG